MLNIAPNPRNKMSDTVSKNKHSATATATPLGHNHNNTCNPKYTMAPSQRPCQRPLPPPLMKGYWPPITPAPLPKPQLPVPPLMSKWPHICSSTPCPDPQFQPPLPMNNWPPTYKYMPPCPNPEPKNQQFQPMSNWPPVSSTPFPEPEAKSQSPDSFSSLKLYEFVYNAVSDDELATIKQTLYLVTELQHFVSNRNASINQPIPKNHFWIEIMELSRTTVITFQMFQAYVEELWEAVHVHYEKDQSQILKLVFKIRDQLGLVYWSIVPLEAMILKFYKATEIGNAISPSIQYPSLIYRAPDEIISARLIYVPPTRHTSHLHPIRLYNPYPYEFDLEAIPDKSPRDLGERANRITEMLFKDRESFLSNKLRKVLQSKGNLKKHAQWEHHYVSNRIAKQSTKSQRETNVSTTCIVNQNRTKQLKSLPEQLIASVSASENGKAEMPLMEIVFGQNNYHGFVEDAHAATQRLEHGRGYSKGKSSTQFQLDITEYKGKINT